MQQQERHRIRVWWIGRNKDVDETQIPSPRHRLDLLPPSATRQSAITAPVLDALLQAWLVASMMFRGAPPSHRSQIREDQSQSQLRHGPVCRTHVGWEARKEDRSLA